MFKKAIVAAFIAVAIPSPSSAESWLCIADLATGFSYDKSIERWEHANFNVEKERFIIKSSDNPNWKFEVNEFGQQSAIPHAFCMEGPNESGYMFCTGAYGQVKFNIKNLRYVETYVAGYVEITGENSMKEGDITPSIEIGRCSKI